MAYDIILALSFSLAFISIVAVFFTDKKLLFGAIALILLFYFYKSNIDRGEADMLTILAFISGILLLALELFVPGFGVLGIIGGLLTIYSLLDSFGSSLFGILVLVLTAASVFISVTLFVRLGFSANIFEKSILNEGQTKEKGYNSKKDYSYLLGKSGKSLTILRPTGRIKVEELEYDAKTRGSFIKKDSNIEVIEIKDGHIIVKEI